MVLTSDQRAERANEITQYRHQIATYATEQQYQTAYWQLRYGDQGRVTCLNDNLKNLDVFALAIRNGSPMIAETHALWLRDIYLKLGMCTTFLLQSFNYMQHAAQSLLSPETANLLTHTLERTKNQLVFQTPVCRELTQHQDAIVEVVVDNMYRSNPFWSVRYGERGRNSCKVDTYYNIAFLSDAIGMNKTEGILIHTRWMQQFLIARGMSSLYYYESWRELVQTTLSMLSPEHHAAVQSVYQQITLHLRYDHDFTRLIENQQTHIISQVIQTHYNRQSALQQRLGQVQYRLYIEHIIAYLVDSAYHDDAQIFTHYIDWLRRVALDLDLTQQDISNALKALHDALPAQTPPLLRQRLKDAYLVATHPYAQAIQKGVPELHAALLRDLHAPSSFWSTGLPADGSASWSATLQTFLMQMADAVGNEALYQTLQWLLAKATPYGASRTYLLMLINALHQHGSQHLGADIAQQLQVQLNQALATLTDDDPALALLQTPDFVLPIMSQLRDYSPYWQVSYQRRNRVQLTQDVFILIGFLADSLMSLTDIGFPAAADQQRHYLIKNGICTAYYQQMIDLTAEVLRDLVDEETYDRALIELDAANAVLESDHEYVLLLAEHQDAIVQFVMSHLEEKHPDWVTNYPGGWHDARTDMYYWLGYLTDALTFNNPQILAAHIAWLHEYSRREASTDHIRVSLIALGHAIKSYLPDQAKYILTVMSAALSKIST